MNKVPFVSTIKNEMPIDKLEDIEFGSKYLMQSGDHYPEVHDEDYDNIARGSEDNPLIVLPTHLEKCEYNNPWVYMKVSGRDSKIEFMMQWNLFRLYADLIDKGPKSIKKIKSRFELINDE